MPSVKRKSSWKKKAVIAGTVATIGTAGVLGVKGIQKRRSLEKLQIKDAKIALVESKSVRRPEIWSKLCGVYNWNPKTAAGSARVSLIESVSRKTGIPSERIMLTLESNRLDSGHIRTWQTRLNHFQKQFKTSERIVGTQKGGQEWRMAKSNVKNLPKKIAQAERVIKVMNELLSQNPKLAKQIQKEKSNGVGLTNCKQRLNLLYPQRHSLVIKNDALSIKANHIDFSIGS